MKTEAFIVSIQYYEEVAKPSVIILFRSEIQLAKPKEEESGMMTFSSMRDFVKSFGRSTNSQNYHKSSMILSLEDYRKSNFKVGDRLEFDVSVSNIGEDIAE